MTSEAKTLAAAPGSTPRRRAFRWAGEKCRCGHVRNSHGQDLPWARCGNTACKHDSCDCEGFVPRVSNTQVSQRGQ